ncbi:hypothetical protein GGI42DRAFT_54655 [Trichoderma sp. SZMC 28013]
MTRTQRQPFFAPVCSCSGAGARLLVRVRARRTKKGRRERREQTNRERAECETQRRGWQKKRAALLMGGTDEELIKRSPDFFFTSLASAAGDWRNLDTLCTLVKSGVRAGESGLRDVCDGALARMFWSWPSVVAWCCFASFGWVHVWGAGGLASCLA